MTPSRSWIGLAVLAAASCGTPQAVSVPRGDLEGQVRLTRDVEITPRVVLNTTDPEICGERQSLDDVVMAFPDRGLAHAIAAITSLPTSAAAPSHLVLDNRDCRFEPHVAVLTRGSTVEATNSDPVLHTTHFYGPLEMNVSLPVRGARQVKQLDKPGMFVVKCDVHGWMQAFVRVDEHPFHAVTDRKGAFRIEGVPAGTHTLEIWHERLGTLTREVVIERQRTTRVAIEYGKEG